MTKIYSMFKNEEEFINLKKWMVQNYYDIRNHFLPMEQALKFLKFVRENKGDDFIQETFEIYQKLEYLGREGFCKAVEEYEFEGFK
tara:strand:- start:315 stop:572 length:258 start_codon:yes stop_codon:yes gene_type:complete